MREGNPLNDFDLLGIDVRRAESACHRTPPLGTRESLQMFTSAARTAFPSPGRFTHVTSPGRSTAPTNGMVRMLCPTTRGFG
jgi:hypothetical protein